MVLRSVDRCSVPLVLLVMLATGPLACRALLGIDDDKALLADDKADGASDGAGSSNSDSGTSSDSGSGDVDGASSSDGETAPDRRYALSPLPPVAPPMSNYEISSETVRDKTTGLVWQRGDPTPAKMTHADAVAYCDGLTLANRMDWRVPSRIELLTILDYGQIYNLVNEEVFSFSVPMDQAPPRWSISQSLLSGELGAHYVVEIGRASVDAVRDPSTPNSVRCVREGPASSPASRYSVANGIARDVRTGVDWQIAALPSLYTAVDAALECPKIGTGWRLPDIRELASLVDEARETTPLVDPIFQPAPSLRFWSGTIRKSPSTASYAVDFGTADMHEEAREPTTKLSVRCARK